MKSLFSMGRKSPLPADGCGFSLSTPCFIGARNGFTTAYNNSQKRPYVLYQKRGWEEKKLLGDFYRLTMERAFC
tara:strand:- start:26 stop:247 length:222 start_codon:yes stop_codon:yes gene_type:complete